MSSVATDSDLIQLRVRGDQPLQHSVSTKADLRGLWARLRKEVEGEVRFDKGTLIRPVRARMRLIILHVPLGVVLPGKSALTSWLRCAHAMPTGCPCWLGPVAPASLVKPAMKP